MICAACGVASADGAAFCRSCGQPLVGYSAGQPVAVATGGAVISVPPVIAVPVQQLYAGFWLRFVAYVIDSLLAGLVMAVFVGIAIAFLGVGFFQTLVAGMQPGNGGTVNPAIPAMFFATMLVFFVVLMIAMWLYFAGMESSSHQGTIGKIALGLKVTDTEGRPISFGRASGRFFAKIITGLVPFAIGYIMAGFTAKKQALHDMIAGCLVLRKA